MDQLFSLTSNLTEISQDYFPPIQLNPNYSYGLGLYSLNTYNAIPNILEGVNNKFHYRERDIGNVDSLQTKRNKRAIPTTSKKVMENKTEKKKDSKPDEGEKLETWLEITIPEGSYEIEAVETFIRTELINRHDNGKIKESTLQFSLKPNLNTLKVELFSQYTIDFSQPRSIGQLLGFSAKELGKYTRHISDQSVQISSVGEIHVECNIVEGSFRKGIPCHTIFSFFPDVPVGYKISLRPTNVVYLPVNTRSIHNLTIRFIDQHGKLINLRGEEISVQLNLRRLWG